MSEVFSSASGTFLNGVLDAESQSLNGSGAVTVSEFFTTVSTDGANNLTLADGNALGQLKLICMTEDNGDAGLAISNFTELGNITFADVGDAALLMWNGDAWRPLLLLNLADGTSAPSIGLFG